MQRDINRQWCLARRPIGLARESDFAWREGPVPVPGQGQVLVRNRYLSIDTIGRAWMREEATFLPPFGLGEVIRGIALGTVQESNQSDIAPGTSVMGAFGWQDYAVSAPEAPFFMPLGDESQVPASLQLGLLGPAAVAAYFGLTDVARPRHGETLVVSAAGSAAGSLAGQIGRLLGCRVVGLTGSREKCEWLVCEAGFDAAIDYRRDPVFKKLREHCPNGIDVFFDSVGGPMLEDVLDLLNLHARIAACGMLSAYNDLGSSLAQPPGPNNLLNLVYRGARLEGFTPLQFWPRAREAFGALIAWHADGKITCRTDLVKGLQNAPGMLNSLFQGSNRGKLVVEV